LGTLEGRIVIIIGAGRGLGREHALLAHLRDRLVTYKLPRTFEFVSEPVRDDAGKVRRSALRDALTRPDLLADPWRHRGDTCGSMTSTC
jgi:acyl-CoA synthetase (AMP-forming)/AMP-acid ligase II